MEKERELNMWLSHMQQKQSNVEEDGGFIGELLLLDAEGGSVSLVVNVGQVTGGGSLSNTAEFIINRSVTKANPALVSTQIWDRDATEMGADSGDGHNGGVTGIRDLELGFLIELSGLGKGPSLGNLRVGESSDKNELTVPRSLDDFTGRQISDIDFLVGISDVSVGGEHLSVHAGQDSLDSENVRGDNETLSHVDLGTSDLVISVFFVPGSVLIEPVIDLSLDIKWVTEVGGSGRGNPVHVTVSGQDVVSQLLASSFVVFLDNTEVTSRGSNDRVDVFLHGAEHEGTRSNHF